MLTIYHNGKCSTSRSALNILQEQNIPHLIRWYILEPMTAKELKELLKKLGMKASEIVRRNEPFFKETLADKKLTENEWLATLIANPKLIQRPIVVNGEKAIIARPAERVLDIK